MSYENGFLIVNGVLKEYIGTDTDVVIPDGVIGIGRGAFLKCKTLNKVAIPSSVRSIGEAAFPRRNIDIRVDQIATWCSLAIERDLFDGWFLDKWGYNLYIKDDLAQTIVVPTEIIDLGKYAFCRCLSLKNITLSEGIKTIGDRAFENCINLESITLPKSLTSIGWAFHECSALKTIQFGTTDVAFDPSDNDPFRYNFFNKDFRIILPEDSTYTGKKLPVQLSKAARNMSEEELAGVLLFQTTKSWRTEAFTSAEGKDVDKIVEKLISMLGEMKKVSATAASNVLDAFLAFSQKVSEKQVKRFAEFLEENKCSKQLSALKEDIVLREKLLGTEEIEKYDDLDGVFKKILDSNNLTMKKIVEDLNPILGVKISDLPEVIDKNGNPCNPVVFAWLMTAHEKKLNRWDSGIAWEKPGLRPEAEQIVALLNPESLQAAIMNLADKYLVQYQNQKKKYLAYPFCRYANESSMAKLTRRAPKWSTGVSGNNAPPLRQLREAVKYSNTRSAMLFAERYHGLDEYAQLRGMSEAEIRDKYLSDVGLDELGGKAYDLGNQTVIARLQKDLSFLFELPTGKTAKSLPKKDADTEKYEAAKDDYNSMRKAVKRIVRYRFDRLFEDFLNGNVKTASDWKDAYLKNPLLRTVAELIVWEQGGNTFILSGMNPIDSEGRPYKITDSVIRVAHPMEMNRDEVKAWQKYFTKRGLKQPFLQIWEPVIDSKSIQEDRYEGSIQPMYRFAGKEKHGIYSCNLHDYSDEIGFELEGCDLDYDYSKYGKGVRDFDTYTLGQFRFKEYTRQVNHIVSLLDVWTVEDRIKKDDVSVSERLDSFTLAQITDFIRVAQETGAMSVLALLLNYKNKNFAEFDPMDEFILE